MQVFCLPQTRRKLSMAKKDGNERREQRVDAKVLAGVPDRLFARIPGDQANKGFGQHFALLQASLS